MVRRSGSGEIMDADDEYVATLSAKDVTPSTLSTSGRKVSSEPGKEVKKRSPSLRASLGKPYVRKVADWLEAGGPRGSIEQLYSEMDGQGNELNDENAVELFDSTMYFDSTQSWDVLEKSQKGSQYPGSGRFGRRSQESLRESRFSDKKIEQSNRDFIEGLKYEDPLDTRTDLSQDFTDVLKYEDPLEHHEDADDDLGAKVDGEVSQVSQSDSLSGLDAALQICTSDASSSQSSGRSCCNEASTDVSHQTNEAIESEDPSWILQKLCLRVQSDAEAIEKNPGELVIALNAGSQLPATSSCGIEYSKDQNFVGGDILRTGENITETAEQALYQTARYGNIAYNFSNLSVGNYFVDLHFAEIVFTNGPPGMRVFDVYIQGEKIISDLDIYGEVGSNKALVLCTAAGVVDGSLNVSFKGVPGGGVPIVSAICVRKAPFSGTILPVRSTSEAESCVKLDGNCMDEDCLEPVEVEHRRRRQQAKSKARAKSDEYEASLEAATRECEQVWISLQEANRNSEKMQNELVEKSVRYVQLENKCETQNNRIIELEEKEEVYKQKWRIAFSKLQHDIQVLKAEYGAFSSGTKDWIKGFPSTATMIKAVQLLVSEHDELKKKYAEECHERKQLYNKVLELKGNIRVFCRCRPLSPIEVSSGVSSVVDFDAVKDNELIVRQGNAKKLFKFDQVFTPQDDQVEVFANTAPVIISVLDGYNVCIFAYGQTGTGKTFTMEGTPENRGVNYRTLEELFHVAEQRKGQFNYEICVSVLEVYNEQIRDLLAPHPDVDQPVKKLEIRQVAEGGHHVPGLVEAQVHSMTQVWDVLQTGSSARSVQSTNCNEHSSRSHCMLCVMVKGQNLITGESTRSKLWLVDLAGSERVAKSDVQGDRLREAQNINKSLSALGDVISALATKSSHIPFRNSKLTHLLQDSLGGDSKTLMFVQISPNEDDVGETLCSLNFASRVRGVELGPARKQLDTSELFKYKQLVERAKQEGRTKEEALKKAEENLRSTEVKLKVKEHQFQGIIDKMKEKDKTLADLAKEKADLEAQLAAERKSRLAATAALKEKASQPVERITTREVKSSSDRIPERRPLLEKVQDFSEAPAGRGGAGSPSPHVKELAEKEKLRNENSDPQQTDASEETPVNKAARTKVVPSRYNSPTVSKKVVRKPTRASIASPFMINPATLTSSFSSDESGQDGSKENARVINVARDVQSSVTARQPLSRPTAVGSTPAISAVSQRRAVTFASPVFQREKTGEVKQREAPQQQLTQPTQLSCDSDRSMSLGGPADAKKLGVGKFRRVSIARSFIKREGSIGAQRVLSSAGAASRNLSTTVPQTQRERRWNK